MMLSYGELLSVCGLGERFHLWSMAYPCKENDILGIRALRGTWLFIVGGGCGIRSRTRRYHHGHRRQRNRMTEFAKGQRFFGIPNQ